MLNPARALGEGQRDDAYYNDYTSANLITYEWEVSRVPDEGDRDRADRCLGAITLRREPD